MTEYVGVTPASKELEAELAAERPRLVGFCARLSGNAAVAEDLAQETPAEDGELDVALERGDLIALLDRALGLLPENTRAALIAKTHEENCIPCPPGLPQCGGMAIGAQAVPS
ncbi:MAG: RNA polymerase sigma factor [Ktedonobacterales bacterium]